MPKFRLGSEHPTQVPKVIVDFDQEHPFRIGNTYVFQLVVVDNSGNESAPVECKVLIEDNQLPIARITLQTPPAVFGKSFTLIAKGSEDVGGGRIVAFRWKLIAGNL